MRLSYKSRQFLRRAWRVALVLLVAAVVALLCWVLWLRRFVIYTADGVKLDFSLQQQFPQGQTGPQGTLPSQPDIYFTDTEPTAPTDPSQGEGQPPEETPRFEAYYVTVDELQKDLDTVLERIQALPEGTPVMLDVKGHWGYFYYSSDLGKFSGSFDRATMDAFFAAVHESGAYAIAKLPAFRDYQFALANTGSGIKVDKGYLWVDPDRCYWLDPADDVVLTYLVSICKELRNLGFDEVAFYDFYIPKANTIVYQGDRAAAIQKAANTLVSACAKDGFTVSFITTDPAFPLPNGDCRLYLENVAAADVQTVLMLMSQHVMERTVFFTKSKDTRFDVCGVIRPLIMAE